MLTQWVRNPSIVDKIGQPCVDAILSFQSTMKRKEKYLANYLRKTIPMSMDAMTTSPVESMNNLIKNKMQLDPNMNLSQALPLMLSKNNERIKAHLTNFIASLQQTTLASASPTKQSISTRCQLVLDQLFDRRHHVKCVQESDALWTCWNFADVKCNDNVLSPTEIIPLLTSVGESTATSTDERNILTSDFSFISAPKFLSVFQQSVKKLGEELFLHCTCLLHHRCGIPCRHVFRILVQMHVSMVNVQYWKCYKAYYNSPCPLGSALLKAQHDQIKRTGLGVPITIEMLENASIQNGNIWGEASFPFLFHGTSHADYDEAKMVLSSKQAMTQDELFAYRQRLQEGGETCEFEMNNATIDDSDALLLLSPGVTQLHRNLKWVTDVDDTHQVPTDERKTRARKNIIESIDFMLQNCHLTNDDIENMEKSWLAIKDKYVEAIYSKIGNKKTNGHSGPVWAADSPMKGRLVKQPRKKGATG